MLSRLWIAKSLSPQRHCPPAFKVRFAGAHTLRRGSGGNAMPPAGCGVGDPTKKPINAPDGGHCEHFASLSVNSAKQSPCGLSRHQGRIVTRHSWVDSQRVAKPRNGCWGQRPHEKVTRIAGRRFFVKSPMDCEKLERHAGIACLHSMCVL